MDKNSNYIIGIDEVGRGPIAGPVAVCAFICPITNYELIITNAKTQFNLPVRDSKKLTKIQREKWYKYLNELKRAGKCNFEVSYVSPENIDKFGINKCIQKALDKSLIKLTQKLHENFIALPSLRGLRHDENFHAIPGLENTNFNLDVPTSSHDQNFGESVSPKIQENFCVYLDGGLKAPKEYINQETVIKGDELHPVISFASIIAKVSRDAVMNKYSQEFPDYGFDKHSGYGTRAHYEAIKKNGITPLHRKSFMN